MKRGWILFVALVCVLMDLTLPAWHEAVFEVRGGIRSQSDIMLDALGELRTFLAKSVWLESDVYHHAMEAHGYDDESATLPLLKTVVMLDPTFEEAYALAGYKLVWNLHRYDEGMELLNEGLQRNPRSWPIRWERAFCLYHLSRWRQAAAAADAALVVAQDDIDQMNCMRLKFHSLETLRQYDDALDVGRKMLLVRPGDQITLLEMAKVEALKKTHATPPKPGGWE
ncbi:MAG TPA: hypothetical protein VGO93_13700 [Candidatus Xenobia bacterium]|jgi:tetratricopeptide (TPR) repeat protein